MTAKLVKSASNDGQITKSELSDGRRAKLLPSVAESPYDWLQLEDYLGNVGLILPPRKSAGLCKRLDMAQNPLLPDDDFRPISGQQRWH